MQRKDLLAANGPIFTEQGKALDEVASRNVKVLVVGNPANTNAYIAIKNAPSLKHENFSAMLRLDHNRALSQVAEKLAQPVSIVKKLVVWGNHSNTQYPDLNNALINNERVISLIKDLTWIEDHFIPRIQNRGMEIITARGGKSSAASAANAIINHIQDWIFGTRENDWVSMGVASDGSYGVPEGIVFSFPVTCQAGKYQIVKGVEISDSGKEKIQISYQELAEEREAIKGLL
jgi:malate dehydrogenase